MATDSSRKELALPVPAIIVLVLVAAGGAGFWYLHKPGGATGSQLQLTPEAKEYVRNLRLADVAMEATESYLQQAVVEITGKITNAGERPLKSIHLNCVFYDPYGQVVLRERVAIVRARQGSLAPGATREFRLPFDNIPQSWNQAMPQLVIAGIDF